MRFHLISISPSHGCSDINQKNKLWHLICWMVYFSVYAPNYTISNNLCIWDDSLMEFVPRNQIDEILEWAKRTDINTMLERYIREDKYYNLETIINWKKEGF